VCACVFVCVTVCVFVFVFVFVFACVFVCAYMCVCMCVYTRACRVWMCWGGESEESFIYRGRGQDNSE